MFDEKEQYGKEIKNLINRVPAMTVPPEDYSMFWTIHEGDIFTSC